MDDNINSIVFDAEFRFCPICGYSDGFHTMLKQDKDRLRWLFICPSCHEIFDIGYTLENLKKK